jgi:hypothetical protein
MTFRSADAFLVELRAGGEGPPAVIRRRKWLKTALRQHGLRAVRVEEVPQADAPADLPPVIQRGRGGGEWLPSGSPLV